MIFGTQAAVRMHRKFTLSCLFIFLWMQSGYGWNMKRQHSVQSRQRPVSPNYQQFLDGLPSMKGKSVVITGCSRGLGFVTAKALIEKGAMVYMLNRPKSNNDDNTNESSDDSVLIQQLVENNPKNAPIPKIIPCDLLNFSSVRRAAKELQMYTADSGGIDVLCNNAGIMLQPDKSSKDGYDITASTNVLSHFLLTKELYPLLQLAAAKKKNGEARIVNMSSASGYGPPAFNPVFFEKRGGNCGGSRASYERYHQSKLGNLLFTAALKDRLEEKGSNGGDTNRIKALACTPGVCGTDMFLHATTVMMGRPGSLENVPSPEDGSMAQLKCICDSTVSNGDLWGPGSSRRDDEDVVVETAIAPPQIFVDETSKDMFWKVCEDAVGKFEI